MAMVMAFDTVRSSAPMRRFRADARVCSSAFPDRELEYRASRAPLSIRTRGVAEWSEEVVRFSV